jgi:acyl-CoA hydrolase
VSDQKPTRTSLVVLVHVLLKHMDYEQIRLALTELKTSLVASDLEGVIKAIEDDLDR